MLITNHVLSGALIGAAVRRPVPAFALGVASHFVLDALPHWGDWRDQQQFLRVAVPDGLAGLAVIGLCAAAAPSAVRSPVLAGMAGAALPDLDKPSRLWFGWSPFPRAIDHFHAAIQHEAQSRAPVELVSGTAFAFAALALFAARRRRSAVVVAPSS
jgi:hypothetical protein